MPRGKKQMAETKIIGDQKQRKSIDRLLEKAGKDKVINGVIGGKIPSTSPGRVIKLRKIIEEEFECSLNGVAFTADSKHIMVGREDSYTVLFNVDGQTNIFSMPGKIQHMHHYIGKIKINGKGLLGFIHDDDLYNISLYEITSKGDYGDEPKHILANTHPAFISDFAFSPDGRYAAVCGGNREMNQGFVTIHEFDSLRNVTRVKLDKDFKYFCDAVAYTPDGKYIITSERTLVLHNADNFEPAGRLLKPGKTIKGVEASPDGRYVAVGEGYWAGVYESDEKLKLTRIKKIPFSDHRIEDISFSPDGKYLAMVGREGFDSPKHGILMIFNLIREK